jgi:hypothetical protein
MFDTWGHPRRDILEINQSNFIFLKLYGDFRRNRLALWSAIPCHSKWMEVLVCRWKTWDLYRVDWTGDWAIRWSRSRGRSQSRFEQSSWNYLISLVSYSFFYSLRRHSRSVLRLDEAFWSWGTTFGYKVPLPRWLRRSRLLQYRGEKGCWATASCPASWSIVLFIRRLSPHSSCHNFLFFKYIF